MYLCVDEEVRGRVGLKVQPVTARKNNIMSLQESLKSTACRRVSKRLKINAFSQRFLLSTVILTAFSWYHIRAATVQSQHIVTCCDDVGAAQLFHAAMCAASSRCVQQLCIINISSSLKYQDYFLQHVCCTGENIPSTVHVWTNISWLNIYFNRKISPLHPIARRW